MKKNIILPFILLCMSLPGQSIAQTITEGNTALSTQVTKFNGLVESKSYKRAITEGVKTSILYTENRMWKEAFATCRAMDALIRENEAATGKPNPELHYQVTKERLRMYMRIKNAEQCKNQLNQLEAFAKQIKKQEFTEDLLFAQAHFYQRFDMPSQSLQCYKKLIQQRTSGKEVEEAEKCYNEMLTLAKNEKDKNLEIAIKQIHAEWKDSIKAVKATAELQKLKKENNSHEALLAEKEDTISTYLFYIIALCVVGVVLGAGVLLLLGLLAKKIYESKKLKQSLKIANDNNEQKSAFINNISAQIAPNLEAMETATQKNETGNIMLHIQGMQHLLEDFQKYSELEKTRESRYELKELDINHLCESILDKAKVDFNPGVEAVLVVPKVHVKTNAEALERILLYLLKNAATHTEQGKITLEFKKRSAHTGQFMVTDTGCGIPVEERIHLFKPFSKIYDLTKGNGLGLPTCNLEAYKLNGVLHLDTEYKKGTRFVLELHA